jgi:hypothetical protein
MKTLKVLVLVLIPGSSNSLFDFLNSCDKALEIIIQK